MLYLTCEHCRQADRIAIEEYAIPGRRLMESAGRGCAEEIRKLKFSGAVMILCGSGNNGGDGFVIARHLHEMGISASVILIAKAERCTSDALVNLKRLAKIDLPIIELPVNLGESEIKLLLASSRREPTCVIVDAMLGTGASGPLRSPYNRIVAVANGMDVIRIAVDLPSGFNGDTGEVPGNAFQAQMTCTFIAMKPGMKTPNGNQFCGEVKLIDIGLPDGVLERFRS